jgi:hypothetical protein
MIRIRLCLLLVISWLTACPSESASRAPSTSVLAAWSGTDGGEKSHAVRTLMTNDAWDSFWRNVGREKPRALNTANEMAIAIFMGERRTGGFGVTIDTVRAQSGKLLVRYQETAPSPDMMVTQALTAPWAVAIVPRSDLPVAVEKSPSAAQPRQP